MVRKLILHGATLAIAASALVACTYHRTVVEEHPVVGRAAPATVVVPADRSSDTTVVVPPNSSVTVEPN